ncbi:MAG: pentapeptide repeat-containing protein [Chloroflexaceae bacterium]|nr:pentapeptide repeat-containing protein [Chloroflexaceae bacterium]
MSDPASNSRNIRNVSTEGGSYAEGNIDNRTFININPQKELHIPEQKPAPPQPYVPREALEQQLKAGLYQQDNSVITLVQGPLGCGKTALVAHVINQFTLQDFPGGFLWGDLSKSKPAELLHHFLAALDSNWHTVQHDKVLSLAAAFWQLVRQAKGRICVVLDQVPTTQQLQEVLPLNTVLNDNVRLICITTNLAIEKYPSFRSLAKLELGSFSRDETISLFNKSLPNTLVQNNIDTLNCIAEECAFEPKLLLFTSNLISNKKKKPVDYLEELLSSQKFPYKIEEDKYFAEALADLSLSRQFIVTMLGVFGKSSWSKDQLMSICLQSEEEIQEVLDFLVERGVLIHIESQKYKMSCYVRCLVQQRFDKYQQETPFTQAAFHLLARHLLDTCADLEQRLQTTSQQQPPMPTQLSALSPDYVLQFRNAILNDLPHIKRVLTWAREYAVWNILFRFARYATFDLVIQLTANAFEMKLDMTMGVLEEPLIWKQGHVHMAQVELLLTTSNWIVRADRHDETPVIQTSAVVQDGYAVDKALTQAEKCEFSLNILSGRIVDGTFAHMALSDAAWIGVLAPDLICLHVDAVGAQFVRCDFRNSVWVGCDVRRSQWHSSILQAALLRHVYLRNAELPYVDFQGAVLETVDLRNCDLRQANFSGATLEDIDFRGAILTGVRFAGAYLHNLRLEGAELQDVEWAGAHISGKLQCDTRELETAIRQAANQPIPADHSRVKRWDRPVGMFRTQDRGAVGFNRKDLRAVEAEGCDLRDLPVRWTDARAAVLRGADASYSTFDETNLRAADGSSMVAHYASFERADLRAAVLTEAQLSQTQFAGACMRRAVLYRAVLHQANMHGADLRKADLRKAQLQGANLHRANLAGACLEEADLTDADLTEANLTGARLAGAVVAGTIFHQAIADGADFRSCALSDEQLAAMERQSRATLPDGREVHTLSEEKIQELPVEASQLRFAQLSGGFLETDMSQGDLLGADLSGSFVEVCLERAMLRYARISGDFYRGTFAGANCQHSRISGEFFQTSFRHVDFSGADLSGAIFDGVDLEGATITEAQLRTLTRLYRSVMPDGTRYDGRFWLAGDLRAARASGFDLNDPEAMRRFYEGDVLQHGEDDTIT